MMIRSTVLAGILVLGIGAPAIGDPETEAVRYELLAPASSSFRVSTGAGETRTDAAAYRRETERIIFEQTLTTPRSEVILPIHYEVIGCSVPATLSTGKDHRITLTFPDAANQLVRIEGRPLPGSIQTIFGVEPPSFEDDAAQPGHTVLLPVDYFPTESGVPARIALNDTNQVQFEFAAGGSASASSDIRARLRNKPEAVRVDGSAIPPLGVYTPEQLTREDNLIVAQARYDANPEDPDAVISLARHMAWYGRYQDAILLYGELIARDPANFRAFRHRGHRLLTLRRFDAGVKDLKEAARLIEEGWPTIQNEPTAEGDDTAEQYRWSTWYHLGLGQFFARDFAGAEASFRKTLELSPNPDKSAAASYWLSNTLGRLGRVEEARALSAPFVPGMDIKSNLSYYELMLLGNGTRTLEETLDITNPKAPRFPTLGFGIANGFLFDGRRDEAVVLYRRIVQETDWLGFGHIGSEVELQAMGEKLAP